MRLIQNASIASLSFAFMLAGCGGGGDDTPGPIPLTVQKATCGASDRAENGLQGQVSVAERAAGFKGFNCNLQLIGQSKGEGASWQHASFADGAGRQCSYHDTHQVDQLARLNPGVVAIDVTDKSRPTPTAYLATKAMLDPWESLKVNPRRQLLVGTNGTNSFSGGPEIDVYDLSGDCRYPQLLSSSSVGTGADGGLVAGVKGHEGAFADDGLTFYVGDPANHQYFAVDLSSTTKPKLLSVWKPPFADHPGNDGGAHGLSISADGNRLYAVSIGWPATVEANTDPTVAATNGLMIYDTSEVQSRKANPQVRLLGSTYFKDGTAAQHTIPVKIQGKPYIVFVDEAGTGQLNPRGWQLACDAKTSPFGMARIVDVSDETKPTVISKLKLETNDPANCSKFMPDLTGLAGFTYDTHYCSVDNKANATTLACSNFEAGIRVYDIRDPQRPKEIAYFNPPAVVTASPGSQHIRTAQAATGNVPDHCSAQLTLDAASGTLRTSCQDNGMLVLKFTNGVWPFPETTTPQGQQN